MTSNAALILTGVLFIIVFVTMVALILYSFSIKNKLKKCPPNCNNGNCSVLPTGMYTISSGSNELIQANVGDLGYVYVGNVTDPVNAGVSLSNVWQVLCLPSPTDGQSLIGLFNTQPNGIQNALQQSTVQVGGENIMGSKLSDTTSNVDATYAQWINVIPNSGGYQLMTSGRYLGLRDQPQNSGTSFTTTYTASPDAVWDVLANFTPSTNWTTVFNFTPVA